MREPQHVLLSTSDLRRLASYVASIGVRMLGRVDEVNDLVQDVLLHTYLSLREVKSDAATKRWIALVAVQMAIRRRKKRQRQSLLELSRTATDVEDPAANPEHRAALVTATRALEAIPSAERRPFVLHCIEGRSMRETAERCACSVETAKRRVRAARQRLRRFVEA